VVHNAERVFRGCITSKHIVQLFDSSDTLADGVATFLSDGFRSGDPLLVVARPTHWKSIANRLEKRGQVVSEAAKRGQLTVCDARRTLSRFMRTGQPVAELFQTAVGQVVERLASKSRGTLWIYGEMVDVLAEERNFAAARYLEELWNDLGLRQSFTLLCGYSSAHFADASLAHMLAEICNRHTHIQIGDEDLMSNWVLKRKSTDRVDHVTPPPVAIRADA
jgi:hypothetical protein